MNDLASTPRPSDAPSSKAFGGVVRRSSRRMLANAAKQAALTSRSGVVSDGGDIANVSAPNSTYAATRPHVDTSALLPQPAALFVASTTSHSNATKDTPNNPRF